MRHEFFAPCSKGLEYLLVDELKGLGAEEVHEALAGVSFSGTLATGYRAVLWSRLASRILLLLDHIQVNSVEQLYDSVKALPWAQHLCANDTLCVDFNGRNEHIRHTQFGAQKIKDAICDAFLLTGKERPSVDTLTPTVRLNAHLDRDKLSLSIDLAGHPLHERGYRLRAGEAPLKETLACAMLMRARWPQIHAQGGVLVDPMCGSGTLLIEAALMAADIAPGLLRTDFGFNQGWLGHQPEVWDELLAEAASRALQGKTRLHSGFFGFDVDARVLNAAEENAKRAGLLPAMNLLTRPVALLQNLTAKTEGLVICNPPYGERLGDSDELLSLYALLGDKLLEQFAGFQAAIITSDDTLARAVGLRSYKQYQLFNGALACKLYLFEIKAENKQSPRGPKPFAISENSQGLKNRLEKNLKNLASWRQRENVHCFRAYDADIPEYAAAIDVYQDHIFIQEYAAPKTIPVDVALQRFQEIVEVARMVFECDDGHLHLRQRTRQKGLAQYEKQNEKGQHIIVREGGLEFWVNLDDYLDTGLFLDHRRTRSLIREWAKDRHFLNLFSYTGSVSVYAAAGGAASTMSVDLSRTYTDWAFNNMELNGFVGPQYQFGQDDAMEWLKDCQDHYDLIFVDPPTFSNSKRMEGDFDVQNDHVALIRLCLDILSPGGQIVFSNNYRRFKLDTEALADLLIRDISKQTLPVDFQRNPRIHQCWVIRRPDNDQ